MNKEKYDDRGNLVYIRYSDGHEQWYKYDRDNNQIHCKTSNGYESWQEYDKNNNEIYFKNTIGEEYWFKYEEKIQYKKIRITKQEFIKKKKVINKINRFEIMDI